jgi:hypothetical protein
VSNGADKTRYRTKTCISSIELIDDIPEVFETEKKRTISTAQGAFKIHGIIAQGMFGPIRRAKMDEQQLVIKQVVKDREASGCDNPLHEMQALYELGKSSHCSTANLVCAAESTTSYYLFLEYGGEDLADHLSGQHKRLLRGSKRAGDRLLFSDG